jgi:hypothetical protein
MKKNFKCKDIQLYCWINTPCWRGNLLCTICYQCVMYKSYQSNVLCISVLVITSWNSFFKLLNYFKHGYSFSADFVKEKLRKCIYWTSPIPSVWPHVAITKKKWWIFSWISYCDGLLSTACIFRIVVKSVTIMDTSQEHRRLFMCASR